MTDQSVIEIFSYEKPGYQPLVFSNDWQVAILNWEPEAQASTITQLEKHSFTDEVFVLIRGTAAIASTTNDEIMIIEAIPGVVYNVKMGSWHTVIGLIGSSWIIVENRDTHKNDTEYRPLTDDELISFKAQLPEWAQ